MRVVRPFLLRVQLLALAPCAGAPEAPPAVPDTGGPATTGSAAGGDVAAPGSGLSRPPPLEPLEPDPLDEIRELLGEIIAEGKSSVIRIAGASEGGDPDARQRLLAIRPVVELIALQRMQDPLVYEMGGVFWALLIRQLDAGPRFFPLLLDELARGDPRRRAFACEALAYFGEQDARPHLQAALEDRTPVPGYTEGTVVADFAARALEFRAAQTKGRR